MREKGGVKVQKEIERIKEKYKGSHNGIRIKFELNELSKACVKLRKTGTTVEPEDLPELTLHMTTEDELEMKLSLPPVSMALHLGMYKCAEDILSVMPDELSAEVFNGGLLELCSVSQYYMDYPDMQFLITIGEIIIADTDIPKSFLKLFCSRCSLDKKENPMIGFTTALGDNDYIRTFCKGNFSKGYEFRRLKKGLLNLYEKCPELLKDMMNNIPFRNYVPAIKPKMTVEEGKSLIREYTDYMKTVIECVVVAGGDIGELLLVQQPIEPENDQDYVTYEEEYRKYVKMLLSEKDLILSSKQKNIRSRLARFYLVENGGKYVVWTNRDKEHTNQVRAAAKRIGGGLGRVAYELIGDDIAGFLNGCDDIFSFKGLSSMLVLLKYSCKLRLRMDLSAEGGMSIFYRLFNNMCMHRGYDLESETMAAVESLEIMEELTGAQEKPEEVKAIADIIVKLGNEELLEVALRKKLLPMSLYEWLTRLVRAWSPALLPCMIAYRDTKNEKEEI